MYEASEYIAAHGQPVKLKGRWFFRDGSMLILDGPVFWTAPKDASKRLQNQILWARTRLAYAEEALKAVDGAMRGYSYGEGRGFLWDVQKLGAMPKATTNTGAPDMRALFMRLADIVVARRLYRDLIQEQVNNLPENIADRVGQETTTMLQAHALSARMDRIEAARAAQGEERTIDGDSPLIPALARIAPARLLHSMMGARSAAAPAQPAPSLTSNADGAGGVTDGK
jgi:hypothetical protein